MNKSIFVSLALMLFVATVATAFPTNLTCVETVNPPQLLESQFPTSSLFSPDPSEDVSTWWKLTCKVYEDTTGKADLEKVGTTVMLMNSTRAPGHFLNILYMRDPSNGTYNFYQRIGNYVVHDPTFQPFSLCVKQDGVDDRYTPNNYYNYKLEVGNRFFTVLYTQREAIDGEIFDTTKNEGFYFGRAKKEKDRKVLSFLFNANTNTGEGKMALGCSYDNLGHKSPFCGSDTKETGNNMGGCPVDVADKRETSHVSYERHTMMDGPSISGGAFDIPLYTIEWASKEMEMKWKGKSKITNIVSLI